MHITWKDKEKHDIKFESVSRAKALLKTSGLIKGKGISIVPYNYMTTKGLDTMKFKEMRELLFPYTLPISLILDDIWEVVDCLIAMIPLTKLEGYQQEISRDNHRFQSHITILLTIDLNLSTETCIYSTVLFIMELSEKLNMTTSFVTFDQPLRIQSIEITTSKSLSIVSRLGWFHMLMCFVGSVGKFMEGLGLKNALGTIYGPNTNKSNKGKRFPET